MAKVVKVIELMSQLPQKPCRTFARLYQEFSAEVDNSRVTNYRINAKFTFDLEGEK